MSDLLLQIVAEVLGQPVTIASSVENVSGWDSLKTIQLVMALDESGFNIPLGRIAEIRSVGDIIALAEQKRNA